MAGLSVSKIHQLMLKVDKEKGNQNKELDIEEEISLFTEQLEKRHVPNARKIVTEYCANSIKFEAKFAKEGTTIGTSTDYAIMAALNKGSYLNENKNAKAVVTGGQGSDEAISEGQCMYDTLVGMGIDKDRIFIEDKAENTQQNIKYSYDIIEKV